MQFTCALVSVANILLIHVIEISGSVIWIAPGQHRDYQMFAHATASASWLHTLLLSSSETFVVVLNVTAHKAHMLHAKAFIPLYP